MRILGTTYYGTRHITTTSKEVKTPADMVGFKLRVPENDVFKAMAEAWGAQAHADELRRALPRAQAERRRRPGESAADDQVGQVRRSAEVPRAVRPHHHAAARRGERGVLAGPVAGRPQDHRRRGEGGIAWQNAELIKQEKRARRHVQGGRHDGDHARRQCVPRAGARQGAEDVRVEVGRRACTRRSRPCSDARSLRCTARAAPLRVPARSSRRASPLAARAVDGWRSRRSPACSPACSGRSCLRYFLGDPLVWSDELARYLFVWCSFLGWVIAARRRSHLAITLVPTRSPPRGQAAARARRRGRGVAFAACSSTTACRSRRATSTSTPSTLFFTMGVVYAIVPVAALAVGLHALADARAALRALSRAAGAAR